LEQREPNRPFGSKLHFGAQKAQKEQLGLHGRKPRDVLVNLIPWNPTGVGAQPYAPPAPDAVATFRNIVASYGLSVTVRKEMGQDIAGACGQLALISKGSSSSSSNIKDPASAPPRDIEDLAGPLNAKKGGVGRKGGPSGRRRAGTAAVIEPAPCSMDVLLPTLFFLLAHAFRFVFYILY
jgi:hypothetical protein